MPRKAKGTQAPAAAPGQPYGEAGAQIDAQQAIPLPQDQGVVAPATTAAAPPLDMNQVLAAAAAMAPPDGTLRAPTLNRGEPVTTGLPMGPGGGPNVLGTSARDARQQRAGSVFRMIADAYNDPAMDALAGELGA